jgi:transcriptional regulator with XRE-family HTH domain
MDHVGKTIRRLREERGLNQAQLAVSVGTGPSAISQIENGRRNPNSETLAKLARALEVEVADLFPKVQAPLSFEELPEEVLAERQRQRFLQQAPSEDERIQRIKQTADIATGYAARWHEERKRIEEEGTHPYGKSIEMGQLQEGFFEAITNDGVYPYLVWVVGEDISVTEAEREALHNVDDALTDMLLEINHMREVEALNKQRANADVARGLDDLEKSLARTPQEGNSKGVVEHRGGDPEITLSKKLEQQLGTHVRVLRERQSIARSDEDLHEAAKDLQHWWLFTFDLLSTFLSMHPEYRGRRLEEAVNNAARVVKEEFPKDAINPRDVPDMAEVTQEWTVNQSIDA